MNPISRLEIIDAPAYIAPRRAPDQATTTHEPSSDLLRYKGPSWYDGRHGKRRSTRRTHMPPSVHIESMPARANSLTHLVPDLDQIKAALEQVQAGQFVVITDPLDKPGTARNIAQHAKEKLAALDPPVYVRIHTFVRDGKNFGAVSPGKADDTPADDTPAEPEGSGNKRGR